MKGNRTTRRQLDRLSSSGAYFLSFLCHPLHTFSGTLLTFHHLLLTFRGPLLRFCHPLLTIHCPLNTFLHLVLTFRQAVAAAVCSLHSGRWWWWWLCAGEAAGRHYPKTDTSLTSNEETVPASLQKISTGSELLFNIKKFPIKKLKQTTV